MSAAEAAPAARCAARTGDCFHCGLPVPPASDYGVEWQGRRRAMCCPGCEAVARAIIDAGLDAYYLQRSVSARRPEGGVPAALQGQQPPGVVRHDGAQAEADLILEGITCPACVWLLERHIGALPGVTAVGVNYTTHRAHVRWLPEQLDLQRIADAVARVGYVAYPYDPARQGWVYRRERAAALRHLAVAGVGMMQVMMLAIALWAGEHQGMDAATAGLLRWAALLLTAPVIGYAALPFFRGAWRELAGRRIGMDVAVSLALSSTFVASAWATWRGAGETYFESVAMFVFFLLLGRYFDLGARQRAGLAAEALGQMLPEWAIRLEPGGERQVGVAELVPGDRVLLRPGSAVPADGRVLAGSGAVDESLLTGESTPQAKRPGDALIGGTLNAESPLEMEVERVGPDTVLSAIQRLLDRAQSQRPAWVRLAERGTGAFVLLVLLLAAAAFAWWWPQAPERALWVAVAVMVVSCPCALALATPVALAAATGRLTRQGVLVTRGDALEVLAQVDQVVFDKTGTLTRGEPRLLDVRPAAGLRREQCLAWAAALASGSEHPVARALAAAAPGAEVSERVAQPGGGVQGVVGGEWMVLGSAAYVAQSLGREVLAHDLDGADPAATLSVLAGREGVRAVFLFADLPREGAASAVEALRAAGLGVAILSGDRSGPVAAVAEALGVRDWRCGLTPQAKLDAIAERQAAGQRVLMVGDGVNDAPVLAVADVSAAMASGTRVTQAAADMIVFSDRLERLAPALLLARRTRGVIRQNLAWALGYNLLALPIAAAGWLTPWMAALGMSLSSLIVVLNAARLGAAHDTASEPR